MLVKDLKDILDQMDPEEQLTVSIYYSEEEFLSLLNTRTTCFIPKTDELISEAVLLTPSTLITIPTNQ